MDQISNMIITMKNGSLAGLPTVSFPYSKFILSIADNGRGLGDISGKSLRNGMKNMRRRLADVRGEFEILPGENGGTVVRLAVPLAKK